MGKDTNTGAKRAREAREELGPAGALPCIVSAVEENLGLPVVIAALPRGIAGCCWRDGDRAVLWVNGTEAVVRQRFTLAHELGHIRCGHDSGLPVETFETLGGKATDSREVQANAFAAELLAPVHAVRDMVDGEPSLEDVVLIAARFGISTIAALYRLNTLGLTSRYAVLKDEIEQGLADAVWQRVSPEPVQDVLARVDRRELPRLSPALRGSALASLAAGSASIDAVADAAGCDPARLTSAAAAVGV